MGHERVGALPKSKQWREVVQGLSSLGTRPALVEAVASDTLNLVKGQFRALQTDPAVRAAFSFLVTVAVSARGSQLSLAVGTVTPQKDVKPLLVAIALRRAVAPHVQNPELGIIAQDAAADALRKWHLSQVSKPQEGLFSEAEYSPDPWVELGNAGGFCELSRLYFASISERYLNFFLEREAASALGTIQARQRVHDELEAHLEDVSKHAFETARITQSFAAGWFTKHASRGVPSDKEVRGFVAHALGKIRGELNREAPAHK